MIDRRWGAYVRCRRTRFDARRAVRVAANRFGDLLLPASAAFFLLVLGVVGEVRR